MAGEYSRELSVKVFAGQCRLVELGYRQGGAAGYGLRRVLIDEHGNPKGALSRGQQKSFQTDRVVLVPGPEQEKDVVRRMYRMFVEDGHSEREIAEALNAEGHLTDLERPWSRASVHQVMTNEKYIGNNVYNKVSFKLKHKRVVNPREMWIRAEGAYPGLAVHKGDAYPGEHDAIIDASLWDEVHEVIANNRVKRAAVAKEPSPALLRGLIFTETGVAMTPHHTKKGTRRYRYYVSMDVIKNRPKAELRGPQRLPGGMVEDAVVGEIRRLLRTPEVAARVSRTLRKDRPDLDEAAISASLTQFDDMWKALIPAEQARVVRLLVARVTASDAGLAVDLRHEGLSAIAALMAPAKVEVA